MNYPMNYPIAVKPGDITEALRPLTQADIRTVNGGQPGEFLVTMPAAAAQHLALDGYDQGGHAGLIISRNLGHRIHITGTRPLRYEARYGYRVQVTMRLHDVARGEATAALAEAGYGQEVIGPVLDEAEKFPLTWAYTPDRRRTVCYRMPGGSWEVVDCAESEARIAAYRVRRGSMLRAVPR